MPSRRTFRSVASPRRSTAADANATRRRKFSAQRIVVLYTTVGDALADDERESADMAANAVAVAASLRSLGHSVDAVAFGNDACQLSARLRRLKPDIVFNPAVRPHDRNEKEPHVAALLELLDLPYTGNGPLSLTVCKNKAITKQILAAHGIPTPRFQVFSRAGAGANGLLFPLMVKPLTEDGSLGIAEESIVANHIELRQRVRFLYERHGQDALVEEFLGGREFSLTVLGNGTPEAPYRVLPPGELVYHSNCWRVCSFDAKWDEGHPSYAAVEARYPGNVSGALRRKLEKLTLDCARIFEIRGYARIDFRLNGRDEPSVLEINPNPDLGPGTGMTRTAESAGMNYAQFLEEILRLGLAGGVR
jgi:D-alanine-D-alanine ligase